MPIYEYTCEACANVFEEILIRSSDEKDLRCSKCGSEKVTRQMSAPSLGGGSCSSAGSGSS